MLRELYGTEHVRRGDEVFSDPKQSVASRAQEARRGEHVGSWGSFAAPGTPGQSLVLGTAVGSGPRPGPSEAETPQLETRGYLLAGTREGELQSVCRDPLMVLLKMKNTLKR